MNSAPKNEKFDEILTIHGYWDGPVLGITRIDGLPYIYESEFNEDSDSNSEWYRLSFVEAGRLSLILEDWEIWLRWRAAFDAGLTTLDTHPALPEEKNRHQELAEKIGSIQADSDHFRRAKGKMEKQADNSWRVQWSFAEDLHD